MTVPEPVERHHPPHVVLVGLMATGKTTVGRRLAAVLDRPLCDSDAQVEQRTGRSVREIWRTDGEAAYRRLETDALRAALAAEQPSVVAAAGGVVLAEENRRILKDANAHVVWLRARPETLLRRLRAVDDDHRPLLDEDPDATLHRMHLDRSPLYREVADQVVDVDDLGPEQVVSAVLSGVGAAPR